MEIDEALANDLFGEPEHVNDPMEIALDDPEAPKNREGNVCPNGSLQTSKPKQTFVILLVNTQTYKRYMAWQGCRLGMVGWRWGIYIIYTVYIIYIKALPKWVRKRVSRGRYDLGAPRSSSSSIS